jgi:hypothetical protein
MYAITPDKQLTITTEDLLTDLRETIEHQLIGNSQRIKDDVRELFKAGSDDVIKYVFTNIGIEIPNDMGKDAGVDVLEINSHEWRLLVLGFLSSRGKPHSTRSAHEESLEEWTSLADQLTVELYLRSGQLDDHVGVVKEGVVQKSRPHMPVKTRFRLVHQADGGL